MNFKYIPNIGTCNYKLYMYVYIYTLLIYYVNNLIKQPYNIQVWSKMTISRNPDITVDALLCSLKHSAHTTLENTVMHWLSQGTVKPKQEPVLIHLCALTSITFPGTHYSPEIFIGLYGSDLKTPYFQNLNFCNNFVMIKMDIYLRKNRLCGNCNAASSR